MKKLIFVLLAIIFLNLNVYAEEIPPRGVVMTKETNPIYWGYLEDYGAQLKQAFEKKRMFKIRGWGASYEYYINRNGTITDMRGSTFTNNYYDKKVKEVILSVKPLPFREGMNVDRMYFDVFFSKEKYEEIHISIGFCNKNIKIFQFMIATKK